MYDSSPSMTNTVWLILYESYCSRNKHVINNLKLVKIWCYDGVVPMLWMANLGICQWLPLLDLGFYAFSNSIILCDMERDHDQRTNARWKVIRSSFYVCIILFLDILIWRWSLGPLFTMHSTVVHFKILSISLKLITSVSSLSRSTGDSN